MNKFRRLVPGFVLALTIALASVSFAQNATQSGAGSADLTASVETTDFGGS